MCAAVTKIATHAIWLHVVSRNSEQSRPSDLFRAAVRYCVMGWAGTACLRLRSMRNASSIFRPSEVAIAKQLLIRQWVQSKVDL